MHLVNKLEGVIEGEAVTLGVGDPLGELLGVVLTDLDTLGVTLFEGEFDVDGLGVSLGVTLIEGVLLGVLVGVLEGVGVGVAVDVVEGVGVLENDVVGVGV